MSFFKGLNFPRVVVLMSFLGSVVLLYLDVTLGQKLDRLRTEAETTGPETVRRIQETSHRLRQLQKQLEDDKWTGQNNPGTYVREIAQSNEVRLGQVDVTPMNSDSLGNGIVDKKYTIKPVDTDRGWGRQLIGNFLFKLEDDSQRVRVTSLKIHPPPKARVRPADFPADEWTYVIEITSRQREG